jgi:hypothetical protein
VYGRLVCALCKVHYSLQSGRENKITYGDHGNVAEWSKALELGEVIPSIVISSPKGREFEPRRCQVLIF